VTETKVGNSSVQATVIGVDQALQPGTTIGEYQIERELGRGGMGAVYAARHPIIGKRVAIKVLDAAFSRDGALVQRFLDEARAVNKIGHPNIIDVFSFGQLPDGRHYFVMEFLEGETMAAWLGRGRPDTAEARRLLLQVCEALEAAHREGIIHRDLKPENLWIARPKHGEPFMKVLDFGIAKLIAPEAATNITKTGTIMGTPHYMSPEQCTGRGVDHRADIYSLGVIIFQIFCGRLPFEDGSVAELMSAQLTKAPPRPSELAAISPGMETLVLSCLDKNPANRPASAAELGRRLRDAAMVGGVVTAIQAPFRRTDEASAATKKGFATGLPTLLAGSAEARSQVPKKHARLLLVSATVVVAALGLWLALRGGGKPRVTAPVPSPPQTVAKPALAPPAMPEPLPAKSEAIGSDREPAPPPAVPQSVHPSARLRPAGNADNGKPASGKPSRAARQGLIQENPF
jgi:serine/threonine-protein kinase